MNVTPVNPKRGIVVTIEGGDGVGKSTQVELVKNRLLSRGTPVDVFDFPNKAGSPIGDLIGSFLRGEFGAVTPEFLSLAFSIDRLVAKRALEESLSSGRIVLCDRYVSSNIAFQSAKLDTPSRREKIRQMIDWLEFDLFGLPKPDVEIVLTADDSHFGNGSHLRRDDNIKRDYVSGDADIHEGSIELQLSVNQIYKELAGEAAVEINRDGIRRSSDDVFVDIWGRIEACLKERYDKF